MLTFGDFQLDVNTDDRGRIVAELWHTPSGKTVGITEVDTYEDAQHWAKTVIRQLGDVSAT